MQKVGNYRWRICALLFFATTVNYVDRNVLSFTMIDEGFRKEMLGLSPTDELSQEHLDHFKEMMGYVDAMFKFAYAMGFLVMGYVIDRIGTRIGYSISIVIWSLAGIFSAFISSIRGLSFMRFLLGLGESGNFPSAIKTVAEWFPKKERSFATGVFNAGANIGIITTALAVPWLTLQYSWRISFVATGTLGLLVFVFWRRLYQQPQSHPRLSKEELAYIQSDSSDETTTKLPWRKVIFFRQTWAFAVGKFLTDPIWWFYLTWLPDFFNSSSALEQKLDLKTIGLPFLIIYLVSDAGSVFFGWLGSVLIRMGWPVHKARKFTMLICALCVVPIVLAPVVSNIYIVVALISLAAAAHQGWSANIFTLTSDMFPKKAIGSVVGVGGMMGAIGGTILAAAAGIIRVKFGYLPLFLIAGSAYLVALLVIQVLVPTLKPVEIESKN